MPNPGEKIGQLDPEGAHVSLIECQTLTQTICPESLGLERGIRLRRMWRRRVDIDSAMRLPRGEKR